MAMCGAASRRKSEEMIAAGRVKVNDILITEMGYAVDENTDVVKIDGIAIQSTDKKYYFAFNKPRRIIVSADDEKHRKSVLDYFQGVDSRLFTVGRLDYDSSGLIFVTNDGEFANRVTHPKYECYKTYAVDVSGSLSKYDIEQMQYGMTIDGYQTSPAKVHAEKTGANTQTLQITIKEGRNRQIRKMIENAGAVVEKLERVAIGSVKLNDLKPGEYRKLSHSEVEYFYNLEEHKK